MVRQRVQGRRERRKNCNVINISHSAHTISHSAHTISHSAHTISHSAHIISHSAHTISLFLVVYRHCTLIVIDYYS